MGHVRDIPTETRPCGISDLQLPALRETNVYSSVSQPMAFGYGIQSCLRQVSLSVQGMFPKEPLVIATLLSLPGTCAFQSLNQTPRVACS